MDTQIIIIGVIIITTAFLGESIFGFGGGLIAVPLLSLLLGIRDAVTLVLIFQTCMGLLILKTYKEINWKAVLLIMPGMVAGTTIGTLFLSNAPVAALQIFLATSIMLFLIKTLWFNDVQLSSKLSKGRSGLAGVTGGLLQGMIGTGGPVLVMYLSGIIHRKATFRGTLIALFFITSIVRVGISVPEQLFNDEVLHMALAALPFFLVAIVLGQRMHEKVSEATYRAGMYIILAGSSLALFAKSVS